MNKQRLPLISSHLPIAKDGISNKLASAIEITLAPAFSQGRFYFTLPIAKDETPE